MLYLVEFMLPLILRYIIILYISVKKLLPTIVVKHVDCKMHPDFIDIKM